MKLSKELQAFAEEAKQTDEYWVERAKLAFAIGLEKQRVAAEMTYAAVAKKIGTSAAYITKVFRGDTNVTIETMVKLARATGGELEIRVVNVPAQRVHWETPALSGRPTTTNAGASATLVLHDAANHHFFEDACAA
jgi:transcriptional regulator with XRE-family HTH domain